MIAGQNRFWTQGLIGKHLREKPENAIQIKGADVAELVDARDLKFLAPAETLTFFGKRCLDRGPNVRERSKIWKMFLDRTSADISLLPNRTARVQPAPLFLGWSGRIQSSTPLPLSYCPPTTTATRTTPSCRLQTVVVSLAAKRWGPHHQRRIRPRWRQRMPKQTRKNRRQSGGPPLGH